MNSYISKKISLSHCKAIIISEELAYDGVSEYIFTCTNNIEVRPTCNVLISKCSANEFLSSFKPSLESVSARYYELILNSSSYTGYTDNIYLADFYENILDTTTQASGILVNINNESIHKHNLDSSNNLNGEFLAGETPLETENKTEAMGITAFKGDKLIGELTGLETLCHLIITNKLDNATVSISNPFDYNNYISLSIGLLNKTVHNVELVNNSPFIECDVKIIADVSSMDYNIDLSDPDNLEQIEDSLKQYLEDEILKYLYKTSKEFQSDIVGFGKYAMSKYLTWQDWIDSDWLDNYQNSVFKLDVEVNVESGYLYTKI